MNTRPIRSIIFATLVSLCSLSVVACGSDDSGGESPAENKDAETKTGDDTEGDDDETSESGTDTDEETTDEESTPLGEKENSITVEIDGEPIDIRGIDPVLDFPPEYKFEGVITSDQLFRMELDGPIDSEQSATTCKRTAVPQATFIYVGEDDAYRSEGDCVVEFTDFAWGTDAEGEERGVFEGEFDGTLTNQSDDSEVPFSGSFVIRVDME